MTDNLTGARDATAHLVARGRRRIAWPGVPEGQNPNVAQRPRGYREVLAAHGLAPVAGRITRRDVAGAVADLWSRGAGITAVVASDRFALGAMGALAGMGVSVPRDVPVMGLDTIDLSANLAVALTTVSVDRGSLGRLAVETLAHRRAWPEAAEIMVAPRPGIVQRGSVSGPPLTPVTAAGAVAMAIRSRDLGVVTIAVIVTGRHLIDAVGDAATARSTRSRGRPVSSGVADLLGVGAYGPERRGRTA